MEDIGIKYYYKDIDDRIERKQYPGTIKERYSDFVVSEITRHDVCSEQEVEPELSKIKEILKNYISDLSFLDQIEETPRLLCEIELDDKSERAVIHEIMRNHPLIKTKTVGNTIQIFFGEDRSIFYHCTLKKINRDTVEACNIICRLLKIPYQNIKFCGNKDKRAITYQIISIEGTTYTDLQNLKKKLLLEDGPCGVWIYNIRNASGHVKLGDLLGNKFKIKIKTDYSDELINLYQSEKEVSFINYFGNQRFGMNMDNHFIGKNIIENNYEKCIDMIMKSNSMDNELVSAAKVLFKKGDFIEALEKLPARFIVERNICRGRLKGLSAKRIIDGIKREIRLLYLHSYQSYLFNIAINNKIEDGFTLDQNDVFIDDTLALPLKSFKEKKLKGCNRKIVEKMKNFKIRKVDDGVEVEFDLAPSTYATIALRELIGNCVLFQKSII
ncbi:Pseudouridylate synthase 7 like protein [Astathelohania contejeani]|uniref:Pseudouridylate synthase 7 like protein n=1 Tax=Astathelohania contejeani TaxID=164912 RepID=A0ABQ7HVL1_9MICR|nr:Pseudouridylate synthase 7 like protein [Thelohania contejeani]